MLAAAALVLTGEGRVFGSEGRVSANRLSTSVGCSVFFFAFSCWPESFFYTVLAQAAVRGVLRIADRIWAGRRGLLELALACIWFDY